MPATMPDKTCEVLNHLKKCAAKGRTAPYSEIAKAVGLPDARDVIPHLKYIRDEICIPQGLPWITALAVMKDTSYPGTGWHTGNTPVRKVHLPVFWSGIVQQVFATDWSKGQSMPGLPQTTVMPAKTKEVFDFLKRCACQMRTVTYDEIGGKVGLTPTDVCSRLDYIRDGICRPQELPWLTALAVGTDTDTDTRLPHDGWIPDGTPIRDGYHHTFWRGMVLQVFAIDWSNVGIQNSR